MKNFKTLKNYSSFSFTLSIKVLAALASALTLSIIAKASNPMVVGQFANFLASLAITISFLQFGFQASYFKQITKTNTVSKRTILMNVIWILAVAICAFFYRSYGGIFDVYIVLFFGIVLSIYNTTSTVIRATGPKTTTAILDNLPKNLFFFIVVLVASLLLDIQFEFGFIIIFFGISVISSIMVLSFIIFQRKKRLGQIQFSTNHHASEIFQTGFAQFTATVNRNIDVIIISHILGFEQAASYKIAVLFLNFSQMKEGAFTHVTAKSLSETIDLRRVDFNRRKIGRVLIAMSGLEIVIFILFGGFILNTFFDSHYNDIWYIVIILLIGNLVRDGFGPLPSIMILQNLQVKYLYSGLMRLIFSFLLIGLMRPENLIGLTVIFAIMPAIEYFTLFIFFKRKLHS